MSELHYSDAFLTKILKQTKTVATVGVSTNQIRPSYYVARYLSLRNYKVLPINPAYPEQRLFGSPIYPDLASIPETENPIQMVDIFRRSDAAGAVVDEALDVLIDRGLETIWMQIGVINEAAAKRAEAAGLNVVMNRCPKIEYQRLFGELRMGGFNTGKISSKL